MFKAGDKVEDDDFGKGKVISEEGQGPYPLIILFNNGDIRSYTKEGMYSHSDIVVSLQHQEPYLSVKLEGKVYEVNKRDKKVVTALLNALEKTKGLP